MEEDGVASPAEIAAAKAAADRGCATARRPRPSRRPISPRRCGASCSPATARRRSTRRSVGAHQPRRRLQAAADKALRAGLIDYDRRLGGWRGAVAHIDPGPTGRPGSRRNTAGRRRRGRMAARAGVARRRRGATIGLKGGGTGRIPFAQMRWARPLRDNGTLGAAPRRAGRCRQAGRSRAGRADLSRPKPAERRQDAPEANCRPRRRSTICARSPKSRARSSRSTRIPGASWR